MDATFGRACAEIAEQTAAANGVEEKKKGETPRPRRAIDAYRIEKSML